MTNRHVKASDVGITARSVTRRDALRLLMGAGIAAALSPVAALAETAQEKADSAKAQADATQQKLDDAQASYEEAQQKLAVIGEEYSDAAAKLSATQGQIATLNTQIADAESAISSKEDEIDQTQADIAAKQERLGERMSASYKSGAQSTLDLILSSTTFEELTSNIYYLDKINAADKDMIDEVKTLKADLERQKGELEDQKTALEGQKQNLEVLQAQQQEELAAAQAKQAEAESLVSSLSSEVQALMEQHDAEMVAAQEAAAEAKRIAEEAKKQKKSWATNTNTSVLGNGSLAAVTSAAARTPSPGGGLCAAWITHVFANAGVGTFGGNACDMCAWWCGLDVSQIKPGMIIAVESSSSGTTAGRIYGHIGVYLGDGLVHHNVGYIKTDTVSSWVSTYCKYMSARCGWLGGIALS